MPTRLNPYLSFRDDARDAMTFYQSVFGGELNVSTFGEFGGTDDPAESSLVMHAQLETPTGFTLMASDTPKSMGEAATGGSFSVSLSGDDDAELRGYWEKLLDGATVTMPLAPAPWGDEFGMLTDRFGVPWMVSIGAGQQQSR
ncbi:VOC family protein [Naasia aerilata]|uniref:VOC family protein n=1 Tax=Naasia aerilata TaxID=1162966 RepID=A0ABN6XM61_9MICO|nr:VOC family protein [Naasia aerilata]BDZ44775.1 VOC family protein [Naasia aerilata]